MSRRPRREFTEEFKLQMVKLYNSGKPIVEIVKEYDLKKSMHTELSGLKWIILAAIPALTLVRVWVTANISELESFYKSEQGIFLKYGIWIFTLLVFMLFDRLGEIKSEKYT